MASTAELNEVKLIIKGLIASSPKTLTLNELNRDYGKEEGRAIPYERFGYRRLIDFIQSIRDSVRVKDNYSNPLDPFIGLIVSEKSEHVVSLVDRQNKPKKKGYSRPRQAPCRNNNYYNRPFSENFNQPYRQSSYVAPPRFQRQSAPQYVPQPIPQAQPQPPIDVVVQKPPSPRPPSNPSDRSSPRFVASPSSSNKLPFIPKKVVEQIMILVRENPGVSPSFIEGSLNTALHIDVKEVYNGIDELLKTMSHMLAVKDNKVFMSPFQGNADAASSIGSRRLIPEKKMNYLPGGYVDDEYDSDEEMYVGGFSSDDEARAMPADSMEHNGGGEEVKDENYICESLMSERMKVNLARLLKKFPNGIWCWDLAEHYQAEYDTPLDCREVGYVTVAQMMRSVPELFRCVLVDSDCRVYDRNVPSTQGQEAAISREMVAQIKELVITHPSNGIKGIYEEHFCSKFKEAFHTEFKFREMGFGTLHSLFEALDGEVIQFVRIAERYRICSLPTAENGDANLLFPPNTMNDETCIRWFPSDVVSPLDTVRRVTFPQNATIGSLLEVIVAEISSPNNFWAQLRGAQHHTALNNMMDEMEVFYDTLSNNQKYAMPAEGIAVGVCCVTSYLDQPHRCRIIKVDSADGTVRIIFIDFGTISAVERSSLRFLHKRFQDLPAQAFRCTLHNLKPTQGRVKYPREVGERFLQLVTDKGLVAQIGDINREATTMSLILIDTTGEDDVFINDVLVEEGLADYCVEDEDSAGPVAEVTHNTMVRWDVIDWDQIHSCTKNPNGTYRLGLPQSHNFTSRCPNRNARLSGGNAEYTDRDGFPLTLLERLKQKSAVDSPNPRHVTLDTNGSSTPDSTNSYNSSFDSDGFPLTLLEQVKRKSTNRRVTTQPQPLSQDTNVVARGSPTINNLDVDSGGDDIPLSLLERFKQKSAIKNTNTEHESVSQDANVIPIRPTCGSLANNSENDDGIPLTLLERLKLAK